MESGNAGEVGRDRLGEEPRYQVQRPTWEHEDWLQSFLVVFTSFLLTMVSVQVFPIQANPSTRGDVRWHLGSIRF